jgi:hypothetical protein
MAYSDFTVTELKSKFGVKFTAKHLFLDVAPIEPTSWLTETLRIGRNQGYSSEKARSERLVSPVLSEIQNKNEFVFAILSGMDMNVDKEKGLNGECDFIFSHNKIQDFVTAPIFCITEAKKQDIELGSVQCAAQLIGAKILNQLEDEKNDVLYGCSTSGETWRFIKYENNTIILDEDKYLLGDLPKILGILQEIVNKTKND